MFYKLCALTCQHTDICKDYALSYIRLRLLNGVRDSVCYMQIPFMIMQHVKHKASALITSTHPPTTVLLPTSLPAEKKGWVGEGVIFDIFDLHHRLFILGAV